MYSSVLLLAFFHVYVVTHEDHHHVISDSEHYEGGTKHNADYDHDAFLGRGHGHDFDSLEPEEAKRRLKSMIGKVDTNTDRFVEFEELENWIDVQRKSYMWETLDMLIHRDDEDKDNHISWKEYKHSHFGKWDDETAINKKLRQKIDKAHQKFNLADRNQDGRMDREEYAYFRHPEESPDQKLRGIAVDEVIDEMDKDDDKIIDLDEFLGQYIDDKGEVPDWVMEDRKHFRGTLDHDKSGFLERDEMRAWVLPSKKDTEDEAKHLIKDADDNNDGKLSMAEILDHYLVFVGSTATDHGKALREEL